MANELNTEYAIPYSLLTKQLRRTTTKNEQENPTDDRINNNRCKLKNPQYKRAHSQFSERTTTKIKKKIKKKIDHLFFNRNCVFFFSCIRIASMELFSCVMFVRISSNRFAGDLSIHTVYNSK